MPSSFPTLCMHPPHAKGSMYPLSHYNDTFIQPFATCQSFYMTPPAFSSTSCLWFLLSVLITLSYCPGTPFPHSHVRSSTSALILFHPISFLILSSLSQGFCCVLHPHPSHQPTATRTLFLFNISNSHQKSMGFYLLMPRIFQEMLGLIIVLKNYHVTSTQKSCQGEHGALFC